MDISLWPLDLENRKPERPCGHKTVRSFGLTWTPQLRSELVTDKAAVVQWLSSLPTRDSPPALLTTPLLLGSLISPVQCQSYFWLPLGPPVSMSTSLYNQNCSTAGVTIVHLCPTALRNFLKQCSKTSAKIQNLATWSHQRAAPWGLYMQKGTFNPQWHADAWLFYSRYLNSRSHTLIYNMDVTQWLPSVVFWAPFPGIPWETNPWTQWPEVLNLHSLLVAGLRRETYPTVLPLLQSAWSEAQRSCYFLVSCSGLHIHIADVLVLEFVCTANRRWAFCTEHLLKVPAHHLSPLLNSSI